MVEGKVIGAVEPNQVERSRLARHVPMLVHAWIPSHQRPSQHSCQCSRLFALFVDHRRLRPPLTLSIHTLELPQAYSISIEPLVEPLHHSPRSRRSPPSTPVSHRLRVLVSQNTGYESRRGRIIDPRSGRHEIWARLNLGLFLGRSRDGLQTFHRSPPNPLHAATAETVPPYITCTTPSPTVLGSAAWGADV